MRRIELQHLRTSLKVFAAHYRQAPLQAGSILLGILLAVTLFVAVQAINLNAKRSYAQSTELLSARANAFVLPPLGQRYLSEQIYFALRQASVSGALPIIEGRVSDQEGQRWSLQGSDVIAAITSGSRFLDQDAGASLSSEQLPLNQLLAGEPLVLISQSQHERTGGAHTIVLEGVEAELVVVPDSWRLGSKLFADIGFAQRLLKKDGQLSYIAVFDPNLSPEPAFLSATEQQVRWEINQQSDDLGALTDSFHLNLTAMSLLAFLVGLFIAYNGVQYSLLKRSRLLVQLQQAGIAPSTLQAGLVIELTLLVLIGVSVGFILGIQLSYWLHPMVAVTLEQLYGATLLPGIWQWQWWLQSLLLTWVVALIACWHYFRRHIGQPLSSHTGLYAQSAVLASGRLWQLGLSLMTVAMIGLLSAEHFRFTMLWLGVLIVAIPLLLPQTLTLLSEWAVRRSPPGLICYLFAELRELVAPLSLAMMALLLAVTANIGMNTLVGSFESTLKAWLEQRLHADLYITPSAGQMLPLIEALEDMEGIESVYTQTYIDDKIANLPIQLGTKDRQTLEQTMVFHSQLDDFWLRFYAGELVAISEPTAVKQQLKLGSLLESESLAGVPLHVGAIFHDYGSPDGEVLIAPKLWQQLGFTATPSSVGVAFNQAPFAVIEQLKTQFNLQQSQLYDQQQIKSLALEIFSRTFAITSAVNSVTLLVAVVGLFSACFMLLDARKAAIARLYALGVGRYKLIGVVVGQIAVLVVFTLILALPLGALVGMVLTDIVTLRAFGWSLVFDWQWSGALIICMITLVVAVSATVFPLWRLVNRPVISALQSEVL
ncbi:FtsX-like permease family protein [Vibrio sp. WXL210]|uniref:ABC transporter permease n=1 Tax=Vibrio sp. WXL210 TaxID=3450709 RepID=UPI003EC501E8